MNGILLLLPFFFIRFGLLSKLDKQAVQRAAHFAPMSKQEKPAYWIYQISNVGIIIYMCFLSIKFDTSWQSWIGGIVTILGLMLLAIAVIDFARPVVDGLHTNGSYRFSRNPMYVAYFVYFCGCALWTGSLLLFLFVLIFQCSAHWIILAEERWCIQRFGETYRMYQKKVRRYI